MSDTDPKMIGNGLGTLFSDFVPFAPSGARRAGAASLMAERIGEDPGVLLKYPMLSQVLSMAAGGALAGVTAENSGNTGASVLAGVAPYLIAQGLKRHKINKIDRLYREKSRKRLRDVNPGEMIDDSIGSHKLGLAQAYEAMRTRKMRDIGAIAEASDALPIATSVLGLGPAASLPFTQLIDQLEARRFRVKKADWSDQINAPAIPAYLGAAGLGALGLALAGNKLQKDLNDPSLKELPRSEWSGLIKHVSGRDLLTAKTPGLNNAFFARAKSDDEARDLLYNYAAADPAVRLKMVFNPSGSRLIKKIKDDGVAVFDPAFAKGSIVGHEAGHAKIEHTPGVLQALQRHLYQLSPVIAPFSAVGGMAAGLATKNTLGGLLAGTGIGLLGGAGMMFPEYMATRHGMEGLKTYKGGKYLQEGDWKRQLTALGTYGALNVLPAAAAGAFGGWIGGRRKKKREAEEGAQDGDGNIIRMDEDARKQVEKAAAHLPLSKRWALIQQAKVIAKQMGADRADRFILPHTGSYLKPSIRQFFNNKDAQSIGVRKGMKGSVIEELLRKLEAPPAPAEPPAGGVMQNLQKAFDSSFDGPQPSN